VGLTHIFVPARHDVSYHLIPIQSVLSTHDAQRNEAPIDSVHTEMFRQVITQVIFVLDAQRSRVRLSSGGRVRSLWSGWDLTVSSC
jgi:hypothetical protein